MTDRPIPPRPLTVPDAAMGLEEVAQALGVSKCRIQQIERKALLKLRKQLSKRGITSVNDII